MYRFGNPLTNEWEELTDCTEREALIVGRALYLKEGSRLTIEVWENDGDDAGNLIAAWVGYADGSSYRLLIGPAGPILNRGFRAAIPTGMPEFDAGDQAQQTAFTRRLHAESRRSRRGPYSRESIADLDTRATVLLHALASRPPMAATS